MYLVEFNLPTHYRMWNNKRFTSVILFLLSRETKMLTEVWLIAQSNKTQLESDQYLSMHGWMVYDSNLFWIHVADFQILR